MNHIKKYDLNIEITFFEFQDRIKSESAPCIKYVEYGGGYVVQRRHTINTDEEVQC